MNKWKSGFSLNEFYFSGRTRLEERLAAAIIGIEFSFESGLISSDLAALVRAEVMMQAEDDNHQDNANDCVEPHAVLIICSPIHRATHLRALSDLSLANV